MHALRPPAVILALTWLAEYCVPTPFGCVYVTTLKVSFPAGAAIEIVQARLPAVEGLQLGDEDDKFAVTVAGLAATAPFTCASDTTTDCMLAVVAAVVAGTARLNDAVPYPGAGPGTAPEYPLPPPWQLAVPTPMKKAKAINLKRVMGLVYQDPPPAPRHRIAWSPKSLDWGPLGTL